MGVQAQTADERDSHDSVGSLVTEAQRVRSAAAASKRGSSPGPGVTRSLRPVSRPSTYLITKLSLSPPEQPVQIVVAEATHQWCCIRLANLGLWGW